MEKTSASILAAALAAVATPAHAAYYLFDGDAQRAVEIDNGAVVTGFNTYSIAYPVAITNTIWLGDRDNRGAREYTLSGAPTGATSAGGSFISQILDGTTSGLNNYGVTCCSAQNQVTIANGDWSNQQTLFNLAGNVGGTGIAYDTLSNSLYVSDFTGSITNYSLAGTVLGQFAAPNGYLVGLAYDQSSNSLWGWNRNNSSLQQLSLAGSLLQSQAINVGQFGISNPFGGEMPIAASVGSAVPEPSTWALMLAGFAAIGFAMRRPRQQPKVRFAF